MDGRCEKRTAEWAAAECREGGRRAREAAGCRRWCMWRAVFGGSSCRRVSGARTRCRRGGGDAGATVLERARHCQRWHRAQTVGRRRHNQPGQVNHPPEHKYTYTHTHTLCATAERSLTPKGVLRPCTAATGNRERPRPPFLQEAPSPTTAPDVQRDRWPARANVC